MRFFFFIIQRKFNKKFENYNRIKGEVDHNKIPTKTLTWNTS